MTALDNAPAHWTRTTIGEVADVRLGRQRSPKNHAGDQMRPYLRAANVDWYRLRPDDIREMNFTDDEMETYALREDDILIVEGSGSATEVGKCVLVPAKFAGHAFQNTLIRVRAGDDIDPRWLMHRINAEAELGGFLALARGSGIFHLGSRRTGKWPIAVPPLAEQRAIVEHIERVLSRATATARDLQVIDRRVDMLESACRHAELRDVLDAPRQRLEDLVEEDRSSAYGVLKPGEDVPGGVPLVRVGDMLDTDLVSDNGLKRIAPSIADGFGRTRLMGGELLISVVGTIGRVSVAGPSLAGANVARAVAVFPLARQVDPAWARLVLRSPVWQAELSGAANEVARKTLNLRELRDVQVPVPSMDDQRHAVQRVAKHLGRVRRFRASRSTTRTRNRALRHSILKAAFEGRLTRDLQDAASPDELHERLAS